MTDYPENLKEQAKLGIQAQEFKEEPFYQRIEAEMQKEIRKLEAERDKRPRLPDFEKIGKRTVIINERLAVWRLWNKTIEDAIKNGRRAQDKLKTS